MSHRFQLPSNYADLQIRMMQAVAAGIEDFSTALCLHDGTIPSGAARLHGYQLVISNVFITVLGILGPDEAGKMLWKIVQEADKAIADGTAVGVPRPTTPG